MSRFQQSLSLLVALAILWTVPHTAQAQLPWQAPTTVSETGAASGQADAAIAPDGTVTLVWRKVVGGVGVIQSRTRSPQGSFGPIEQLSAPGGDAFAPRVAITRDGETIATWTRDNGHNHFVQVRSRTAGGSFGPVTDLSPTGNSAYFPDIAVGGDGTVAIAWSSIGATIVPLVSIRRPGEAFGPAESLIGPGERGRDPSVVVRDDGAVVVAWLRRTASTEPHFPGGYFYRAQSSMQMPGEGFRLAGYVSRDRQNVEQVELSVGHDGTVAASYSALEWDTGTYVVEAAPLRTGFVFGDGLFAGSDVLAISDNQLTRPGISIDPEGKTTVFWLTHVDSGARLLQTRTALPGGAFSTAVTLSTAGRAARSPSMSTGPDGTTTAIWAESTGTEFLVRSRTRPPGGAFGAAVDLGTQPGSTYTPAISVGRFGMATATWSEAQGPDVVVRSSSTPRPKFDLNVNASGGGQGRIVSAPAGIDCATDCVAGFDADSTVTLTAKPAPGSGFAGWSGDCSGQDLSCEVAMDQARTVGAEFSGSPWVLPPVGISDEGDVRNPRAAGGDSGEFGVVWQTQTGAGIQIHLNHSRPGRGFGGTTALSPPDANSVDPDVALGRGNETAVVWRQFVNDSFVVVARTRAADGEFEPATQLSPAGRTATAPRVALGPDGSTTVAWFESSGTGQKLVARTGSTDGSFGPAFDVSEAGQMAFAPQIGTDAQGRTTFGWVQSDGSNFTVRTRTLTPQGVLSPESALSQTGRNATVPRLEVGRDGTRAMTWLRSDGSNLIAQGSVAPVGSPFGSPVDLSGPGAPAKTPTVAIESSGEAIFAWIRDEGTRHLVQVRTVGSTTGPVKDVHEAPGRLELPELETGPDGSAVLLVRKREGSAWQVMASLRTGSEGFEPFAVLAEDEDPASIHATVSPFGRVTAVWSKLDGGTRSLESVSTIQETRTLSLLKSGDSPGLLTSEPAGIECGTTCTAEFERGTAVTLVAKPGPESMLANWGDLCSGSAPTCETTLDQAREAEVTFVKAFELAVSTTGEGNGFVSSSPDGIDCGGTCTALIAADTVVTLSANPGPGMVFSGWNGACSGQSPTCQVTLDQARNVTAAFAPAPVPVHELTVNLTGDGSGRVTSTPAGIDCGDDCRLSLEEGTVVTLTATPDEGSRFTGWTGACEGEDPTCRVTMDQALNLDTAFARDVGKVCPARRLRPGPVRLNRSKGTARLKVVSGGVGRVILRATPQVRKSVVRTDQTGRGRLLIRARGKAAKKLKRRGRVSLRITVIYDPGADCTQIMKTRTITLRKKR